MHTANFRGVKKDKLTKLDLKLKFLGLLGKIFGMLIVWGGVLFGSAMWKIREEYGKAGVARGDGANG